MRLALVGGVPDMPDLPDMMSGNLKRMTLQDGRPGLSHAAASAPAWRPEAGQDARKARHQGKEPSGVACASHGPHPAHAFHPSRMMPHEVGRARHARHAPDIGKAMSGREKR